MRDIPPEQSLIEYPCQFPIKVIGMNVDGFAEAVVNIATQFDPTLGPDGIETRTSSAFKYLSVTVTITATSRVQLDELYRTLSTHPLVRKVL
jgi:uncharacterized protein